MSTSLAARALDREHLLARSALCRLQMHRHSHEVRQALYANPAARALRFVGRVVLAAKVAGYALALARAAVRRVR